jgi:CBS domain-containing protein
MHSNIFFDFRCGYGDSDLVENLRKHLFDKLSGQADLFFYHLARNAVESVPLLGIFNNIKVEKSGKHKNAFNIKKAMTPMVDFARIYALHNKVTETNTIRRLKVLNESGVFEKQEYDDYIQAYIFLMQLRLTNQLRNIMIHKTEADNYIKPGDLSHIEQRMLKEIFKLINKIQQKISIKFTAKV